MATTARRRNRFHAEPGRVYRTGELKAWTRNQCVHPIITLLEKLDAITRRYHRADNLFEAAAFARHYEDAAKIILHESSLLPVTGTVGELAREMLHQRQIRKIVRPDDPAFELPNPERRTQIEAGYRAIQGMFWGPRTPLSEARGLIIEWLRRNR